VRVLRLTFASCMTNAGLVGHNYDFGNSRIIRRYQKKCSDRKCVAENSQREFGSMSSNECRRKNALIMTCRHKYLTIRPRFLGSDIPRGSCTLSKVQNGWIFCDIIIVGMLCLCYETNLKTIEPSENCLASADLAYPDDSKAVSLD
jgi:hypothetical protein